MAAERLLRSSKQKVREITDDSSSSSDEDDMRPPTPGATPTQDQDQEVEQHTDGRKEEDNNGSNTRTSSEDNEEYTTVKRKRQSKSRQEERGNYMLFRVAPHRGQRTPATTPQSSFKALISEHVTGIVGVRQHTGNQEATVLAQKTQDNIKLGRNELIIKYKDSSFRMYTTQRNEPARTTGLIFLGSHSNETEESITEAGRAQGMKIKEVLQFGKVQGAFKIFFEGPLPAEIDLGRFYATAIKRYIPRHGCVLCGSAEHHQRNCTSQESRCYVCGETGHGLQDCNQQEEEHQCRDCKGNHITGDIRHCTTAQKKQEETQQRIERERAYQQERIRQRREGRNDWNTGRNPWKKQLTIVPEQQETQAQEAQSTQRLEVQQPRDTSVHKENMDKEKMDRDAELEQLRTENAALKKEVQQIATLRTELNNMHAQLINLGNLLQTERQQTRADLVRKVKQVNDEHLRKTEVVIYEIIREEMEKLKNQYQGTVDSIRQRYRTATIDSGTRKDLVI